MPEEDVLLIYFDKPLRTPKKSELTTYHNIVPTARYDPKILRPLNDALSLIDDQNKQLEYIDAVTAYAEELMKKENINFKTAFKLAVKRTIIC